MTGAAQSASIRPMGDQLPKDVPRRDPVPGLTDLPDWLRRNVSRRARRLLLAASFVALAALAVAIPLALHAASDRSAREARADRATQRERVLLTVERQRPRTITDAAARRRPVALIHVAEAAILADARARNAAGELANRPAAARCTRIRLGQAPGALALDCLAVGRTRYLGVPFRARAVLATGTVTWCRTIYEVPGEEPVPLSPRCTGVRAG